MITRYSTHATSTTVAKNATTTSALSFSPCVQYRDPVNGDVANGASHDNPASTRNGSVSRRRTSQTKARDTGAAECTKEWRRQGVKMNIQAW